MKILKVQAHSYEDLVDRMHRVPLLSDPDERPYDMAPIYVKEVEYNEFVPCQKYALEKDIKEIDEVYHELLDNFGIDMYNLRGYLTMTIVDENTGQVYLSDLTPPVVEWSQLDKEYILCDGLHRCYHRFSKLHIPSLNAVIIDKSGTSHPYYALPNPNSWEDVELMEEPPADKNEWKLYREPYPQCKRLFRDFNAVFYNVTASRAKK